MVTTTPKILHHSIPLGTRSIGYLTRLLKPQLDEQKLKESFTTWELQLAKYKPDNDTLLLKQLYCSMRQKEKYSNIYNYKQEHHNIRADQSAGNRVPHSSRIIEQVASTRIRQQQQPRTSTNGHRRNMVQQRQRQERQAQGQRKPPQRQRPWRLHEQQLLQQSQRRKRQSVQLTGNNNRRQRPNRRAHYRRLHHM